MSRAPQTSDGRNIIVASKFGASIDPYICGVADKITSPVARGGGTAFSLSWASGETPSAGDTKEAEWSFLDYVRIAAGGMMWKDCEVGDHIDMRMIAKATPATSTPGTGNTNKVSIGGGANIFVPAAGDGDWTLDLAPILHADSPVPIPNVAHTGYWSYDEEDQGLGSFAPDGLAGSGYDFFDFEITLVYWVRGVQFIGSGQNYIDPGTVNRKILPHWTFKVKLTNGSGHAPLAATWYLNLARKSTV